MPLVTVHSPAEWIARFGETRKQTVVTIGNFDGLHIGHQKILQGVTERAKQTWRMSTVMTFYPHPAKVLRPSVSPSLLQTLEQRLAGFESAGVEAALVIHFDAKLSQLSPEDFVKEFLVEAGRARLVLVGTTFRFGHRQTGDMKLLRELGGRWGFEAESVQPVTTDGVVISSTAIRQAVLEGRPGDAARMLGRPFALDGEIQTGTGLGRKFVVPTLNLKTKQETLPKRGVYATETAARGAVYRSVTNVGMRPTFNGSHVTIESHLFNFNENWTSGKMEVRFLKRLRDEQKFSGPDALRTQILKDIEEAKVFFEA